MQLQLFMVMMMMSMMLAMPSRSEEEKFGQIWGFFFDNSKRIKGIKEKTRGNLKPNQEYLHLLSPIDQSKRNCFEPAMQGRDVICRAKTGAGKTLAFGIPIMDKIFKKWETNGRKRNPIALVLAPKGALARRDELVFRETAPLDTLTAYGGMLIGDQMRTLKLGVDALFGTPGRIIDLTKKGALHLKDVQFVVLDEADQMLDAGFEICRGCSNESTHKQSNHSVLRHNFTTDRKS